MTDTELAAIRARCEATENLFNRFKNLTISVADIPALLERIEELEEALACATAQNAATLAEHTVNFIRGLADAVAGANEKTIISMKFACPYCDKIMETAEEAREHDATCESHPAVIRAIKAEADKAALVEALELLMKAYEMILPGVGKISIPDYALMNDAPCKARAAISRVKEGA